MLKYVRDKRFLSDCSLLQRILDVHQCAILYSPVQWLYMADTDFWVTVAFYSAFWMSTSVLYFTALFSGYTWLIRETAAISADAHSEITLEHIPTIHDAVCI